jgi:D-alanine-D-alanine ligase
LAQEYLEDAIEIQCGALQKKNGDFIALPPIEIIPKKNVFFDYDSKYLSGGATEITPPVSISKKLSDKISILSIEIHKLLALKTYSRTDFMVKNGKIYFLETNTLPGMTATSLLPQEANSIGISYPQLLDFIISNS